jgi:hypothetical protein
MSAPSSIFESSDFERAYLNADSAGTIAEFSYSFKLQDSILKYKYGKTDEDGSRKVKRRLKCRWADKGENWEAVGFKIQKGERKVLPIHCINIKLR